MTGQALAVPHTQDRRTTPSMFHPELLRAVADARIADLHAQADQRRLARQARRAAKAARDSRRSERAQQQVAEPEPAAAHPTSPLAAVGARPAPDHERQ